MLFEMSATEYLTWKVYFSKQGFRFDNDNWRMGQICASVWNIQQTEQKYCRTPQSFYEFTQASNKTDEQLMALGGDSVGVRFG
jgi:Minor tail protein T.